MGTFRWEQFVIDYADYCDGLVSDRNGSRWPVIQSYSTRVPSFWFARDPYQVVVRSSMRRDSRQGLLTHVRLAMVLRLAVPNPNPVSNLTRRSALEERESQAVAQAARPRTSCSFPSG